MPLIGQPTPAVSAATVEQVAVAAAPSVLGNLLMVCSVGGLDVGLSLLANVIVPLTASKQAFADYRLVILYAGYAGISHLGLLSGMYLAVVGKTVDQLDWPLLRVVKTIVLASQAILLGVALVAAATVFAGTPAAWIGVVSVACWGAINLTTFHNYLFQGTNRFRPFFLVNVTVKMAALTLLVVVASLGLATTRTLVAVFAASVFTTAIVYELLWRRLSHDGGDNVAAPRWPAVMRLWRNGFVLHVANVCLSLLFTMGPLTVSLLFSRAEFADYAFVSGLVSVLYVGVDGLTAAATPFLARAVRGAGGTDSSYVLYAALAWILPSVYWPASSIVERFVPAYAGSIPVLLVLCASLPASLIVRSRTVAVETAAGRQGALLRFAGWRFALTVVAVLSAYWIGRSPYAVAVGWTTAMVIAGCSRLLTARGETGLSSQLERRLVIESAAATAIFLACAAGGRQPGFLALYVLVVAVVFGARRVAGLGKPS